MGALDQIDGDIIQQLRNGELLSNPKLRALQQFVQTMVRAGCNVSENDVSTFLSQGYSRRKVLEVVLLMSNKLIAIFSNRIMGTDLDEALMPAKWEHLVGREKVYGSWYLNGSAPFTVCLVN